MALGAGFPCALVPFQNWDVFAIGAMLVGLLAFERRHDVSTGAALAIGAVVKLFPAVLVLPLRLFAGPRVTGGARGGLF